jgi:hypothetical protein
MASVRFNQSFHAESHDEPEAPVPVELVKENDAHVCFFFGGSIEGQGIHNWVNQLDG